MRSLIKLSLVCVLSIGASSPTYSQQLSEKEILAGVDRKLRTVRLIAVHPLMVRAVRVQNEQSLTLDEIKQRDAEWVESGDAENALKRELLNSEESRVLKSFVENNPDFSEAFVTDNQGANVAVYPLTSDYWQGDEDKWVKSFNGGDGKIYIGELEFDESSNTVAIQVSAPVLDRGQTIGVLVVGITQSYLQQ